MRELFTARFWVTLAAIVVLALVVVAISSRSDPAEPLSSTAVTARRVDTGGVVTAWRAEPGWALRSGSTVGSATVELADGRTFLVGESTPATIECDPADRFAECTLLADLLGDAIVWFALLPGERDGVVTLPGVVAVLDEGREARLDNGWIVPLVDVVRRECTNVETSSFRDFVARVGADSVALYDLELDEVSTVVCNAG